MKKIFLTLVIALGAATFSQAQEISDNAIGLRFGGADGFGTEVSYQRALGGNNRLELDLGIENNSRFDAFQIVGIYQWVWNIEDNFNWYAGPGAGIASVDYDNPFNDSGDDSETVIFIAGQIGIEYSFDFPLLLSLDVRPALYFADNRDDLDLNSIALGARYQF